MKKTLKNWIIATRPWSFPASTMPSLVAVSYVFYVNKIAPMDVNWWFGVLAFFGAAMFQAAGNLISDFMISNSGLTGKSRMAQAGCW